ncbi:ArsR family transcriptional regulator, partial [Candidatus Altiarchaeota archaeon]
MSDKITLDRETFKVLSADTRIDILKRLEKRKKTLTDLSQEMGMSPSTIKEHIDKLLSSGLIEHI